MAKLRGSQLRAGCVKAENQKMRQHQQAILSEQCRQLRVHGAMRAGTEICAKKMSRKSKKLVITCRRASTTGKGKYQSVGSACRLSMAFDMEMKTKSVSRKYDLGPKAVALNRASVAEIFMRRQLSSLKKIVELATSAKPLVVVTQRKWDETRHLVTMDAPRDSALGAGRDHVEVMVSSIRLVIRWADSTILILDIISPPCPLLSPSASNIYAALHAHPLLEAIVAAVNEIRAQAATRIHINEFDGAPGNDKLVAADCRHPKYVAAGTMYESNLCCNHQQHLVSLSVLAVLKLKLTTTVLTSGYFLSYSGHWSRLVNSTRRLVESKLKIEYREPEEHWADYAVQWAQFIMRNERMDVDKEDGDGKGRRSHHNQVFTAITNFIAIFNGPWWEKGSWVHCCRRDGSCCGVFGDSDLQRLQVSRDRAVQAIRQVILRRRPGKASANKWSKLAPAFQFFVLGSAPHGMLVALCEEALQGVRACYEKALDQVLHL